MPRTGDLTFVKELNRSIVLNVLRFQGAISRTQIAKLTGLNKATVSSLIDELMTQSLVMEVGRGPSQAGRKPILLVFNANAGRVIGIDLEVDDVRIVATDLSGQVVQTRACTLSEPKTPQAVIGQLVQEIEALKAELSPSPLGIIGVGVGVPGLVDFARGIVINAPNLKWKDVHLKALLENYLNLPVYVDNEANAGALGERLRGAGRGVSNLVYVSVGVGIGAGVIVNQELVRGAQGVAGEFGHMTVEPQGLLCSCGNQGCWEMYASEKALVQEYRRISGQARTSTEILDLAENNQTTAMAALQFVIQYMGIGIANIVNGLNPALILIGNRASQASDRVIDSIAQSVKARSFIASYIPFHIRRSALAQDACAIGAASLVLHDYFAGPMDQVDTTQS